MPVMIRSQDGGIWEVHGLEPVYSSIGTFIYGYIVDKTLVRLGKYESKEQAKKVLHKLEQWYTDPKNNLPKSTELDEENMSFTPRIFRMPQLEELGI